MILKSTVGWVLGRAFQIFKFSKDVRKIIYTTNAIESLNSSYRKLNRQAYGEMRIMYEGRLPD